MGDEDYYYDWPEDPEPPVMTEDPPMPIDDEPVGGSWPEAIDPFEDFTGTDPDSGLIFENGEVVGIDLGDGTYASLDGERFDSAGNSLGLIDGVGGAQGGGFLSGIGNFLSGLFGGSGGGAGGGMGGSMGGAAGQLAQKASQAAQQLQQAQQQGASAATLQQLQRQLAVTQQALDRIQGGGGTTGGSTALLVAGGVGLVLLAMARRRD